MATLFDESEPDVVRFYRASEIPYGCFSNLYRRAMTFEGVEYPTAEHAYQSAKPRKPEVRDWLLAAPSPSLLAVVAHNLYSWDVAPGWSAGRRDRMNRVVLAKFQQHPDLAKILLSTGQQRIAESATTDNEVNRRWGEVQRNGVWVGTNWLGLILMDVRSELVADIAEADDVHKSKLALDDAKVHGTVPWDQVRSELGL